MASELGTKGLPVWVMGDNGRLYLQEEIGGIWKGVPWRLHFCADMQPVLYIPESAWRPGSDTLVSLASRLMAGCHLSGKVTGIGRVHPHRIAGTLMDCLVIYLEITAPPLAVFFSGQGHWQPFSRGSDEVVLYSFGKAWG